MRAKIITVLVSGLIFGAVPAALADPGEEEPRELNYLGSQTVDLSCCLFHMPPDPPPPVCDHTDGILGSGIHGFGEGRFCGIEKGRSVRVYLDDDHLEDPKGGVYCPTEQRPYQVFGVSLPYPSNSFRKIGDTDSQPAITVPHECVSTSEDGGTDLHVRLRSGKAVAGTATLVYTD